MTETTSAPIRVLHVDDSVHDRELVRDALEAEEQGFAVTSVPSEAEFRRCMEQASFDVVLTDYNISGVDGLQLLEIVKQYDPHPPVIMLTGTGSEEIAVQSLKNGAADYVLKTVKGIRRLGFTIRNVLADLQIRRELAFKNAVLENLLETTREGIVVNREPGVIISYNRRFLEIWRIPEEAMTPGSRQDPLQRAMEQVCNPEEFRSRIRYLYDHPEEKALEEIYLKDGRTLERYSTSMVGQDGTYYGRSWYFHDITKLKQNEQRLLRLNRMLKVLSETNTLIVHAKDRDQLFREACRIAVETGEFRFAWIGVIPAGEETAQPQAWAGHEEGYLKEDQSLVHHAYRKRGEVVINDLSKHPSNGRMNQEALARGYRAIAALPLMNGEEIIGAFALYAAEPSFFDEDELKLLRELTDDIAYATINLVRQERLDYLAAHDPLTGLPNREVFSEELQSVLHKAGPDGRAALLLCDINRFRYLNNTYGRHAGDIVLQETGRRLQSLADSPLRVSRVNADTFALIETDMRDDTAVATFIKETLVPALSQPVRVDGREIAISFRTGVSLYPVHSRDAETLYQQAETALWQAGKTDTPYLLFDPEMESGLADTVQLQQELRSAFEDGRFMLHYQPRIALASGQITALDALIRWDHPERGLLSPPDFIHALEQSGQIRETDLWALRQAARDYRRWCDAAGTSLRVAVTLSAGLFRQPDVVESIRQAVRITDKPVPLDIKVTENTLMYEVEDSITKLRQIKQAGLGVVVDDFGTGYASLSNLARLPVDFLKIDRAFIHAMAEQPESMTLVSTIITLAHSLKFRVIAGGVETKEQVKYLRLLRCDEMQGYLYSKPLPAEEITGLLKGGKVFNSVPE